MMDRLFYYLALLANILQIAFSSYLFIEGYGREAVLALLLMIPPGLSLVAIHFSPDFEERRLARKLRKAKLRKELEALEKI